MEMIDENEKLLSVVKQTNLLSMILVQRTYQIGSATQAY
jgi:hypothetical protein